MNDLRLQPFSGRIWRVKFRPTMQCNLGCRHCHYACGRNISENPLPDQWWLDLADTFVDFFDHAGRFQGIDPPKGIMSGGEPLLRKNLTFQILEKWGQALWRTYLATNAELLDENDLVELRQMHLRALRLSIDGGPKEHATMRNSEKNFAKNIEITKRALELGINVTVLCCVHDENVDSLQNACEMFRKLGGDHVSFIFNPVRSARGTRQHGLKLTEDNYLSKYLPLVVKYAPRPTSWKRHTFLRPELEEKWSHIRCSSQPVMQIHRKKLSCGAPTTLDVHSNGETRACIIPECTGDLKSQSISEIVRSNFKLVESVQLDPVCEECEYMKNGKCKGGCLGAIWSGKRTLGCWADDTCPLVIQRVALSNSNYIEEGR